MRDKTGDTEHGVVLSLYCIELISPGSLPSTKLLSRYVGVEGCRYDHSRQKSSDVSPESYI